MFFSFGLKVLNAQEGATLNGSRLKCFEYSDSVTVNMIHTSRFSMCGPL